MFHAWKITQIVYSNYKTSPDLWHYLKNTTTFWNIICIKVSFCFAYDLHFKTYRIKMNEWLKKRRGNFAFKAYININKNSAEENLLSFSGSKNSS